MASKVEDLLTTFISELEKRNKPLSPQPKLNRPQALTNFFLLFLVNISSELGTWSPPPPSSTKSLISPAFASSPTPSTTLTQRRYLKQGSPLTSKTKERIASLELENTNLQQQNKVLYKQVSDYRELLQEYKTCYEKADITMNCIKATRDTVEGITQVITADIKLYEAASHSARKLKQAAIKNWRRFVKENVLLRIEVKEVIKVILREHAMKITVFKEEHNVV